MRERFLAMIPFFDGFSEEELAQIAAAMQERSSRKGAIVFLEGEEGDELFVVVSGIVNVYRITADKKIVLATFHPGDFFGEMALFEAERMRSATAEVAEDAQLLVLKRKELQRFLHANAGAAIRLVAVLAKRLRQADELIQDMTFMDVRSRIYKRILLLAEEHGVYRNNEIWINLRMTHQQIADLVGCTREMASKVISELRKERLIAVHNKRMVVTSPRQLMDKIWYA